MATSKQLTKSEYTDEMSTSATRSAYDVFDPACPSRALFSDVAKRWSLLVLSALRPGPQRFGHLATAVGGISDRMLSQTLKVLSRNGLVEQIDEDGASLYQLTGPGHEVARRADELVEALYAALPAR